MKNTTKEIGEPLAGGPKVFLVLGEMKYCARKIRGFGYGGDRIDDALENNLGTTILIREKKAVYIVFTQKPSDETIVHEAIHAAIFCLSGIGIHSIATSDESMEEILCRMIEHIFLQTKRLVYAK